MRCIIIEYKLIKSSEKDIERLIKYKKATIFQYAKELPKKEIDKINNYIDNTIKNEINNYYIITINDKAIGCLLLTDKDDGKLIDELYIEEEFRNKGIGTDILKNIIKNNNIIYLWVYKENKRAITLYKKLGFKVIDETETRYYMKYMM